MTDHTRRFSDRVADYIQYRPDYPREMTAVLQRATGLQKDWIVADIGSGTAISSVPFLENGNTVYAVEPNAEMRHAAETLLTRQPKFISIDGTAEHTTLPAASVDLVFSAQAFHWFDPVRTKAEFGRILKPGGKIALVWNQRDEEDPFQKAYEALLNGSIEGYSQLSHRNLGAAEIAGFFAPNPMQQAEMPHRQIFDLEGLKGRLLSASYAPKTGPVFDLLMQGLERLFGAFQQNGRVEFKYRTHLYWSGAGFV